MQNSNLKSFIQWMERSFKKQNQTKMHHTTKMEVGDFVYS